MKNSIITKALIVPGLPHPLLAPEKNPGWQKLRHAFEEARKEIENSDADLILYFSTQWLSVLGYSFQADPKPSFTHVDHNFHALGSMKYEFRVDTDFAKVYAAKVKALGHNTMLPNYYGFPIDTGTIVAQKLLNPTNRLPAAMVSCNMYAEKQETISIGRAAATALQESGKRAIAVLVSGLSNRFFVKEVDAKDDHISSAKDEEWNRKICELLSEGRLEDVAQVAREFGKEANGDMGFKGIWWLSGLCGETNAFSGKLHGYAPIYGTGNAVVTLTPKEPVLARTPDTTSNAIIDAPGAPEPVGAYPHARREGDFLFLSGVGPRARGKKEIPGVTQDSSGKVISYDIEIETRSVIHNVKAILEASGSSLDKVVDVQVFLTDMQKDFPTFNKIYAEVFGKIQATRTTIEINRLPTPIHVELKVIARV